MNCYSVRWATKVQDYFTYAKVKNSSLFFTKPKILMPFFKVFALFMIIVTGFVNLMKGQTQHFTWENTVTDPTVIGTKDKF